jgi:tetratricopeptide (TPR) repeat protein/tRNA A-37 threonylcarbamoyl transferase component Bud32
MPQVDADRNLLLGILAHQMDFVSRDALFEAMNAWIIRKETPLGALLVERGDLAKSRRDLLEMLVDEHVKAHGGDPARSLQALSSIGPVAEDLGKFADPDIQASVGHLKTVVPADSFATRAPDALGQPTSWNGRFRVVRPHASGGLGVVSVAMDDELDREVAFKEIKEQFADEDGKRARFVLEAEITGKLEHPGIIPIYGLGHDPTGRPFYAMRFIRGDSLADAINRFHDPSGPFVETTKRSLQLRELLGRFLDVCNSMAYAHSRGVLHRDLKPGNIMLGPFGETLVVDWGLALPLEKVPEGHESTHFALKTTKSDSTSLPREQGQVVGTPAYMPPEQAEGLIDQLGPRSDVYGLGAILYDLLTGKHPVEGASLEETLEHVRKGQIKPPRLVRPEIPAPLEAICLKALSLKPEARYATPKSLAADIKSWLADEPVTALKDPFTERARRWAKKNRTAVTAAAAALLVGIVGLGAITAVLITSNIAIDKQRRKAEDREAQAIAAVNKFGDVIANDPELKKTEALKPLRKRLLNEPLAFFRALRERLQADNDTKPESLARLASASFDLGKLTDEIGDKQDAIKAYQESLSIYQVLADAYPKVSNFKSDLADCHHKIGNLLSESGYPVEALRACQLALLIRQKLADAESTETRFRSNLAASHNSIGILLSESDHPAEALKAFESALSIQQKLADVYPSVSEFQRYLAIVHNSIGVLLSNTGHPAEALKAHESALLIRQKLADANPAVTQFQSDLATSHNNIGNLLSESDHPAEALKAFESALSIQRKLADANPSVTQFQSDLATSHRNIGLLLSNTGHPAEALKAYELALPIFQKLADANPAVIDFQRGLAVCYGSIAIVQSATDHPAEALKAYELALPIFQKLADDNTTVPKLQADLAHCHNNIGILLSNTGHPTEALKAYESALVIRRKLANEYPKSPDIASDFAGTLEDLALFDLDAKRLVEARVRLREAVEWQRMALTSNPANTIYRQFLANHLTNLISAARGLGDSEEVAKAERERAELRDSDPAMIALDARLSAILKVEQQPKDNPERLRLAQRAYNKGLCAAAAKLWGEALASDPKLAENRQTQTRYNAACAAALAGCGQGKDVPAPDEVAKGRLRQQARGWLQAELAVWAKFVDSGPAQARPFIVQTLKHWQEDGDLAGVREAKALEALPEGERKAWQGVWAEVEALLARASKANP